MRPDFSLHLFCSIIILYGSWKITGSWKHAIAATLCLQVSKEVYDYFCKGGDVDLTDFAGDATAFLVVFLFRRIRKT